MEGFDLDAFRQHDQWPEETVELTDLGHAVGATIDANPDATLDEAIEITKENLAAKIEEVRRRIHRKKNR